ncbi:MAG: hypothetical protein F7B95_03950 [Desulfurococcales archaeon]|nr:hypothetical protein [Desulfurococcales archaeon]
MGRLSSIVFGVLYIIVSVIIAGLILLGDERLSILITKVVVAVGVAVIGVLAGASLILSSRYEVSS